MGKGRTYLRMTVAGLVLAIGLLVAASTPAQDWSKLAGIETQQPTCRCCIADPGGKCCQSFCNIASLQNTSRLSLQLGGMALGFPEAGMPPDVLGKCVFRTALKIENYSEVAAAREFLDLSSVKTCDAFVPTLLQERGNILAALRAGTMAAKHVATSRRYADLCLAAEASVYKPVLSPEEIRQIVSRIMLLVSAGGRPYCHGFRVNGHIVTADHCLPVKRLGAAIQVRTVSSPRPLGATVVLRGAEQGSESFEKDYALLKLDEPFGADAASDIDWLGAPLVNARLLLVQANMYKQIAAGSPPDSDFDQLMTTEDNPSCRIFGASTQGFLLNGCQSDSGTSGAPYIQKDTAGKLRFVGVHGGQTGRLKAAELTDCAISLPNYGVKLPLPELRKSISGGS